MSADLFTKEVAGLLGFSGFVFLLMLGFWFCLGIFRNFGYYRMAKKSDVHGAGFIFFPIIWVEPIAGLAKQSYRFYKRKKRDLSPPMFIFGFLGAISIVLAFVVLFADSDSLIASWTLLFLAVVFYFIRTILRYYCLYWIFRDHFPQNATLIFISCLLYQFFGGLVFTLLGLAIIPLLCPDLFWVFAWVGSGRVPVSITGVGYGEEQPSWEEWEMSLSR